MFRLDGSCICTYLVIFKVTAATAVLLLCLTMQTKKFYNVGHLMARSLVQGGSGLPFFAPPMYQYICGVEMSSIAVSMQDVPNLEALNLLEKISVHDFLYLHDNKFKQCIIDFNST